MNTVTLPRGEPKNRYHVMSVRKTRGEKIAPRWHESHERYGRAETACNVANWNNPDRAYFVVITEGPTND